jgi:hypothetical protein
MHDPVDRMVRFVRQQKQQAAAEHARAVWSARVAALLPAVEEVVEVLRAGLAEPAAATLVSAHARPKSARWPLVVLFQDRQVAKEPFPRLASSRGATETGASAVFRCDEDGVVHGLRYPFHDVRQAVRAERFVDLGEPAAVRAGRLCDAVADFLEWATVGEGCGRRRLRFWSSGACVEEAGGPVRLGIVTEERAA